MRRRAGCPLRRRVLVVEDDPLIREFVVDALREEAFTCSSRWRRGACLLQAAVAEVLITDIRLPGKIDGWQIAKRCREHHPELRYRWS